MSAKLFGIITSSLLNSILIVKGTYDCTTQQPNQDCYILCNGNEGCDDNPKTFTCNPGYDCIFNATHNVVNRGLVGGVLYAQDANNLYVHCNGPGYGGTDTNCDMDFYCPDGGGCYFYADYGNVNYPAATIHGQDADLLYIETKTNEGALYQTNIYCPTKKTDNNCIVKINGYASAGGPYAPLRNAKFYVTESFNGLTLECDLSGSNVRCGEDALMYCGNSYGNSCTMTYNGTNDLDIAEDWICTDLSSPCQGLTFSPTTNPTSLVNVYLCPYLRAVVYTIKNNL